jgi:hypothetical protein
LGQAIVRAHENMVWIADQPRVAAIRATTAFTDADLLPECVNSLECGR